jgi:hypothetical protein
VHLHGTEDDQGRGHAICDEAADLAEGRALRDAGADLLIVHAGTEVAEVLPALDHLARLLPSL